MTTPSLLLLTMGLLGATDILCFHMLAHGLRGRPQSRGELLTHFLRGPTYCLLLLGVPNFALSGAWPWALVGLLAFDAGISLADFWLEPASRRDLGGLPRGEYLLHVLLAMLFGGLVASVLYEAGSRLEGPILIRWLPLDSSAVPLWLRGALTAMAPVVLWTGLLDLRAVLKLRPA